MKKYNIFKKWHTKSCNVKELGLLIERNDEDTALDEAFKSAFSIDGSQIKSAKKLIMNTIDKNRYSKNLFKKLFFGFSRRAFSYAACAASILFVVLGGSYLINLGKNSIINNQTTGIEVPNTAVIETLPLQKEFASAVSKHMITKIPDGMPWSIAYSGNSNILFFSSGQSNNYLISYKMTSNKNNSAMRGAELDGIGCDYTSGEVTTMFEPSPDGNSTAIWNCDMNGGGSLGGVKPNVYLFNFNNFRMKEFKRNIASKLALAWSPSSRYFGFVDVNGGNITLYDSTSNSSIDIPFINGKVNSLFISDMGDITVVSDKNYMLSKGNNYKVNKLSIDGYILGYDGSGKIECYSNGKIYRLTGGAPREVADIGAGFKLVRRYKVTGAYENYPAIFTDGNSTKVYFLGSAPVNFKFNYDSYMGGQFSPDLKMYLYTDMDKDGAANYSIIAQDGSTFKIPLESTDKISNLMWFDNTSLAEIKYGVKTLEPGDFIINRIILK